MPIVIAFLIYFSNKRKIYLLFSVLLIILVDTLIYISMERSAFFLTLLSILYIIFFTKKYKLIRLLCFVLSITIITIVTIKDEALKSRMLLHPMKALSETLEKKYVLTNVHDSLYKTSIKMFSENKVIGIGPKMYRKDCSNQKYVVDDKSCGSHPHNIYLQLLAETGIIGFGIFFIFIISFVFKTLLHFKNLIFKKKNYLSDFMVCIMASIFINIWPIIPTGNFFNNWISIVYYLPLGFYFSSLGKQLDT